MCNLCLTNMMIDVTFAVNYSFKIEGILIRKIRMLLICLFDLLIIL